MPNSRAIGVGEAPLLQVVPDSVPLRTKPNERQANEHPPVVRDPGTSSIVRCARTRLTCGSLKDGAMQGLEALGTLKNRGQRSSGCRPLPTFVFNAEQEYYAIYSGKNALLHGKETSMQKPGAALFGACDASRAPISRRTVLECTLLTFRPVVCAGSVDPLLPRPPRCIGRLAQDKHRAAALARG